MVESPFFPINVVIVQSDNRALARAALCSLLQNHARFMVVGEAGGHDESLALMQRAKPDVVVLDAMECNGAELALLTALVTDNAKSRAAPRVLVVCHSPEAKAQQKMVGAGALGLVLQSQDAATLFRAIECLAAGEIWLERKMAARVMREEIHPRPSDPDDPQERIKTLTERENEVITLVCEGLKNQAIAEKLFVSEATVRHRLTSIFEKLGISDRLELVIFAYRHGLAEVPR